MQDLATEYFEKLFKDPNEGKIPVQEWSEKILLEAQNQSLKQPITRIEIKAAPSSLKSGSALGPDGFSADFFKENWNLYEEDVLKAIKYFFTNNFIYFPINAITLTLIPKVENPINMSEFRPISFFFL